MDDLESACGGQQYDQGNFLHYGFLAWFIRFQLQLAKSPTVRSVSQNDFTCNPNR
ncbi:hypothetical protein [Pseudomonas sp. microsymbiont 2]